MALLFRERSLIYSNEWTRVATVNSMSKNFGAPGLRVGWVLSHPKTIAQLASRLDQECIAVCSSSQQQACQLFEIGNHALLQTVAMGRQLIEDRLARWSTIHVSQPAGGIQFWVQLPVDDIEAFADYMLLEAGLVLTTSHNYAGITQPCIRIPMGYPQPLLAQALTTLADGLAHYGQLQPSSTAVGSLP